MPAVSAGGRVLYFTAFGALAAGGTRYTDKGSAGRPVNVYRYDAEGHRVGFVATVDTFDLQHETQCGTGIILEEPVEVGEDAAPCAITNWYTTPDGRYALFGDSLPVGSNNVAANGCAEWELPSTQGHTDGRCTELYRYDAAEPTSATNPVCVSCGSGEADSAGNAQFARSADPGPAAGPVRRDV